MKRMMIIIGISLSAIVLGVLVLAFIAPNHISIRSKAEIKAPKGQVYDQLRHLSQFPNWSPFRVADPNQKFEVTGTDGAVGSAFHWEGVVETSKGHQTITALDSNHRIFMECQITAPYASQPTFEYTLKSNAGGVEVAQQFELELAFPTNIIAMMIGLENKMAETNQFGLDRFKAYAENNLQLTQAQP